MEILGIDIGGSGIKGAPVDVDTGALTADRFRIPTPEPSLPDAVAAVVATIAQHFNWHGPIGCTFPAVVKNGVTLSAANVARAWLGADAQNLFTRETGCPVLVLNDADAAGIAEMQFGVGKDRPGIVLLLTLGTGIGSALFVDGLLVPNTEFGHIVLPRGSEAEHWAADRIRTEKDLSWKKWAKRLNEVLTYLEILFSPDLFILGGGVSKNHDKFMPLLKVHAPVVPARLLNEAGIVGAALAAKDLVTQ
jgi:polyphosphate glucokinase